MMAVRRPAAADQTRLLGNQSDVIPVANPARFRKYQDTLVNLWQSRAKGALGQSV